MGMLIRRHVKSVAPEAPSEPEATEPEVEAPEVAEPEGQEPEGDAAAEGWHTLTDEQLAEAYAVNVGGNATSRKGQTKALEALDAD